MCSRWGWVFQLANHGRVKLRDGKENCSYDEWARVVGFCKYIAKGTDKQKRLALDHWESGSVMEIQEIHMKNIPGQRDYVAAFSNRVNFAAVSAFQVYHDDVSSTKACRPAHAQYTACRPITACHRLFSTTSQSSISCTKGCSRVLVHKLMHGRLPVREDR